MPREITNEEYLRGNRPQVLLPFEAEIVKQGVFTLHAIMAPCEKAKTELHEFSTVAYPKLDETRASIGSIVRYEDGRSNLRSVYIVGAQALHGVEITDPRGTNEKLHVITPEMPIGTVLIGKEVNARATMPRIGAIVIRNIDQSYRPNQSTETTPANIEEPEQTDPHLAAA